MSPRKRSVGVCRVGPYLEMVSLQRSSSYDEATGISARVTGVLTKRGNLDADTHTEGRPRVRCAVLRPLAKAGTSSPSASVGTWPWGTGPDFQPQPCNTRMCVV